MENHLSSKARWCVVVTYAIAMAWVEAAVVYYLRTMVDRIEPHQPHPLPIVGGLGSAELVREAATLIMLLAVGILAGKGWRSRLGYAAIAFGFWDIFYYIFLKTLCGWPYSPFDWDVLFLLPLPWWGPVLAPVLISLLMIIWGTLANLNEPPAARWPGERRTWAMSALGAALALYVFMADTIHVMGQGAEAVRNVLPIEFHWGWFWAALALMSAPAWLAARKAVLQTRPTKGTDIAFPLVGN